jgi:curved DNA-binding protein CbpA
MSKDFDDALLFFSLPVTFEKEDLKKRYRELALKYHPDRGEYTSDVLFVQLMQYHSFLESYLNKKEYSQEIQSTVSPKPNREEYNHYKDLKYRENEAVLHYFNSRKNLKAVELDERKNKELAELKGKLEKIKQEYEDFIRTYPTSIWNQDIIDCIENLKVWFK